MSQTPDDPPSLRAPKAGRATIAPAPMAETPAAPIVDPAPAQALEQHAAKARDLGPDGRPFLRLPSGRPWLQWTGSKGRRQPRITQPPAAPEDVALLVEFRRRAVA